MRCILDHAGRQGVDAKAFLTENYKDFDAQDVRAALAQAGVSKRFRSMDNLLQWLGAL